MSGAMMWSWNAVFRSNGGSGSLRSGRNWPHRRWQRVVARAVAIGVGVSHSDGECALGLAHVEVLSGTRPV